MFYSEQLLTKTGPLARVWLASNVERKLTKVEVLKQDISTSVHLISDTGSAPMALRMSGQLMLGVVRIYRRKAGYLLEDSATELRRFVESQHNQHNNNDMVNPNTNSADLNLPATLTIDDLFPALDFGFPLTQLPATQDDDRALAYDEDWTSSLDPKTQDDESAIEEPPRPIRDDDEDLGLDLGEDVGLEDTTVSIQVGRGEETPRPDDTTIMPAYGDEPEDLGLDLGEDVPMPDVSTRAQDQALQGIEGEEPQIQLDDETAQLEQAISRDASPLSEADPEFMQDMDRTFQQMQEEDVEVVAQQRPVSRRLKPMVMDQDTVLSKGALKAFSEDRSKILKPASFLPEDPELLALMTMQRNGDFVTNAMNDGFASGWAPEIQGLLSFDAVYRSGRKRKRDSGIADIASEDEHSDKSPRLDRSSLPAEEAIEDEGVEVRDLSPAQRTSPIPEVHVPVDPNDPSLADIVPGEDDEGIYTTEAGFDYTEAPLVAPEDSGPISVGTQHAVHRLREVFGGSPDADSPSTQSRRSVLLEELIPEARTSREDATKMFFEILVLATKDAIKVEQRGEEVGLPIRVRAKRGLWGQWAEPTQTDTATQEVGVTA